MVVGQAIREGAQRLSATSETARLDAELLMAHALGMSRSEMLLRHMQDEAPDTFATLIDRRAAYEPVAYIIGTQEFLGRSFAVSPAVLIPRSDSESVVLAALQSAPDARSVLDLGTGSGALLLSLLAESPEAKGTGIDASEAALEIASSNAARLGVSERATLLERDWTKHDWREGLGRFDLVIANPPYVETHAELDRDVRDFEPQCALFAGEDGLDDYRIIIPQLPNLLAPGGVAVLEIGALQARAVSALAESQGFRVETHHDLAKRDRALVLRQRAWQSANQ
ncbi:peptide chain release factor N(5)-glutamine methyltransferase [Aurantiacibacter gangjinensis]|uniref:Release factor glutamine methyltransferase n=1 Tax=Aurantiacibacter gangjinensis TaxID=502682 RepID=A0A0G9MM00_9SPHN|nr:peptide chain release factor N(5)-glutamine methyltransferase [Aurantiacibacter gangjinensis]APE27713.1 Protein-N(5)-glutamine methyltransferase PrmC [Aurantiacibacter gangjinensis]KLE31717.1 SAM-dependent methyltransferase [Aurantiacibacter gangjinensis]